MPLSLSGRQSLLVCFGGFVCLCGWLTLRCLVVFDCSGFGLFVRFLLSLFACGSAGENPQKDDHNHAPEQTCNCGMLKKQGFLSCTRCQQEWRPQPKITNGNDHKLDLLKAEWQGYGVQVEVMIKRRAYKTTAERWAKALKRLDRRARKDQPDENGEIKMHKDYEDRWIKDRLFQQRMLDCKTTARPVIS